MDSPPVLDVCSRAVARAARARRQRAHDDPRTAHLTPAALAERIVGIATVPRRGRDGWWLVRHVIDTLDPEGGEFDVWYRAGDAAPPRLGLARQRQGTTPAPPPTPARYFCGLRLRWVDAG